MRAIPFTARAKVPDGVLFRERFVVAAAGVAGFAWLAVVGWGGYAGLRNTTPGLDYLAVGIALLPLAVLVSLGKAGVLRRWAVAWRGVAGTADEQSPW